jgi:hypothetical protein
MEPTFRNVHDFPLKQTKTNLVDYVSGTWFINQDRLYALKDGMEIEPADNPDALARLQLKFAAFRAANSELASSLALMPGGGDLPMAAFSDKDRAKVSESDSEPVGTAALAVGSVTAPSETKAGQLTIRAVFANTGATTTDTFVPLVVLLTEGGREMSESYGPPQRLLAGASVSVELPVQSRGVLPGRYFLSVLPCSPGLASTSVPDATGLQSVSTIDQLAIE